MPKEIKPINWETSVLKRQEMYFGTNGATPEAISADIAKGILILGCADAHVVYNYGWWFVYSSDDWINKPNILNVNINNVFNKLHGFPEAGQNYYRSECMSFLFSSILATSDGIHTLLIKGEKHELIDFEEFCKNVPTAKRIIGFKFKTQMRGCVVPSSPCQP